MHRYIFLAGTINHVLGNPIRTLDSTVDSLTTKRDISDLCGAPKNADTWSQYHVGDFVLIESTALQPFSQGIEATFEEKVPGLAVSEYSCAWNSGTSQCDPADVLDYCSQNPQYAFALAAIANFVNYIEDLFQAVETVVTTMTPSFANF